MGFAKSVSFKVMAKTLLFCCAGTVSPTATNPYIQNHFKVNVFVTCYIILEIEITMSLLLMKNHKVGHVSSSRLMSMSSVLPIVSLITLSNIVMLCV